MNDLPDDAAGAYNNPDFNVRIAPDLTQLGTTLPARVGAPAPEFEVMRLDGGWFRLADVRGRRHVVLMTGAITSPMTAIALPEMNELWHEFGPRDVDFFLLYVKESHPAEHYPHHTSMEQKTAYARELERLERPAFPVLVDRLDGDIHRRYGPRPVSLFVIHKNGLLVFRSTTAHPAQLRAFLHEIVESDVVARKDPEHSFTHTVYTEFLVDHKVDEGEHYRVYERAGPKAFEDYWKVNPIHRDRWPKPPADHEQKRQA